jgi:hypothetical protein
MANEHTSLPWAKHPVGVATVYSPGAKNRIVAGCGSWTDTTRDVISEQEANAQLIVVAVNSHKALVEALKATRRQLVQHEKLNYSEVQKVWDIGTAALRLAGELEAGNESSCILR